MALQLSQLLQTHFLDDIITDTAPIVEKDRGRYQEIYDEIKRFCSEQCIFISDPFELLEIKDSYLDVMHKKDFRYNIYSDDPYTHASALVKSIYECIKHNEKYERDVVLLKMKTIQERKEFTIEFDTRIIASIFKLQKQKERPLFAYLPPTEINGSYYLPAEVEIIDIYKNLYQLESEGDFVVNLSYEQKLYDQIAHRKEKGYLGGGCTDKKRELIEFIKLAIVTKWIKGRTDLCLVGVWAYEWMKNPKTICVNKEKIQIVTDRPHTEILLGIEKFVSPMTKFQITAREQLLHIPKDFRTTRYTFYMNIETERGIVEKPFLDLFNCASFEVIPFSVQSEIQIASKYVILRFLYIDLWILKLIFNMGKISKDVLQMKIEYCWRLINEFRGEFGDVLKTTAYFGVYRNYLIDKKNQNLKGKKYFPFIPALSKK